MAMEARLSLRQSQRVVMTPLLQQAIQLLQLSTLELQEVVQKELLENPMLEEVNQDTPETTDGATATTTETPAPTVEPITAETPPTTERQTDELPFDFNAVMSAADDDHEERSLVSQEDREDLPFENVVRTQVSLADHLEEQLRFATSRSGASAPRSSATSTRTAICAPISRRSPSGAPSPPTRRPRSSSSSRASTRPAWRRGPFRSASCSSSGAIRCRTRFRSRSSRRTSTT
jgi:hypothetical protein